MNEMFEIAVGEFGVKEIAGSEHNPEVLKYFNATDSPASMITDETSWCSAFICWCADKAGYENTRKLNARSWLTVGEKVETPMIGDVVVYWRESVSSWKGHVGMYVREAGGWIYTLGGNQSNQVGITAYPKSRLLGYRSLRCAD